MWSGLMPYKFTICGNSFRYKVNPYQFICTTNQVSPFLTPSHFRSARATNVPFSSSTLKKVNPFFIVNKTGPASSYNRRLKAEQLCKTLYRLLQTKYERQWMWNFFFHGARNCSVLICQFKQLKLLNTKCIKEISEMCQWNCQQS